MIINSQLFIHYPSCTVITVANSSTYLNFFNIKSIRAVTAKNPANKPSQSLLTQPLLQFMFNNDFQESLKVKKSDYSVTDWELLTSQIKKTKMINFLEKLTHCIMSWCIFMQQCFIHIPFNSLSFSGYVFLYVFKDNTKSIATISKLIWIV